MTTLNARANQAWDEHLKASDDVWSSDEKTAFEEGWETGYKTATHEMLDALEERSRPLPTREEIAKALDHMAFDAESRYHSTVGAERRRDYALQKADAVLKLLGGLS